MGENCNNRPKDLKNEEYRFDAFGNGRVLLQKKKGRLPAMGWNSWNAFGSGNTEALTKAMADAMVELGLDKLGYQYVVLDDGCYKPERIDGKLANETGKFPNDFRALSDYIHARGLKFGMYNDIGTNLCAGAAVGVLGMMRMMGRLAPAKRSMVETSKPAAMETSMGFLSARTACKGASVSFIMWGLTPKKRISQLWTMV